MGNSLSYIDPKHASIWNNLCALSNNASRYSMLEKILVHPEYGTAAKYAGVYSQLLDWKLKYEKGFNPIWNFEPLKSIAPPSAPAHITHTAPGAPGAPIRTAHSAPAIASGGAGVISHSSVFPTEIDRPRVQLKTEHSPTMTHEDKISLNPKSLNMSVFNKLFEEHRTADPDVDDGYGSWLKDTTESTTAYKGTVTKDNFNTVFAEQAKSRRTDSKSAVPEALYMHTFSGSELGRNNSGNYTKASYDGGAGGLGYTDLRYAYGEGATFSHEVEGTAISTKSFSELEAERSAPPVPLSTHEQTYIDAMEKMRAQSEDDRRRRLTTYDSSAESRHAALMSRVNVRPS